MKAYWLSTDRPQKTVPRALATSSSERRPRKAWSAPRSLARTRPGRRRWSTGRAASRPSSGLMQRPSPTAPRSRPAIATPRISAACRSPRVSATPSPMSTIIPGKLQSRWSTTVVAAGTRSAGVSAAIMARATSPPIELGSTLLKVLPTKTSRRQRHQVRRRPVASSRRCHWVAWTQVAARPRPTAAVNHRRLECASVSPIRARPALWSSHASSPTETASLATVASRCRGTVRRVPGRRGRP
jgi:hypothetical protein